MDTGYCSDVSDISDMNDSSDIKDTNNNSNMNDNGHEGCTWLHWIIVAHYQDTINVFCCVNLVSGCLMQTVFSHYVLKKLYNVDGLQSCVHLYYEDYQNSVPFLAYLLCHLYHYI